MTKLWFISDLHLCHENSLKWEDCNGMPQRPFDSISQYHHQLIRNWNSVVGESDKVYVLGDVIVGKNVDYREGFEVLKQMKGSKTLIRGNHDQLAAATYLEVFSRVEGVHTLDKPKLVMTHIPIHPSCADRWWCGVHGHTHSHNILNGKGQIDWRYFNVCVEQINYTPIGLEALVEKVKQRRDVKYD